MQSASLQRGRQREEQHRLEKLLGIYMVRKLRGFGVVSLKQLLDSFNDLESKAGHIFVGNIVTKLKRAGVDLPYQLIEQIACAKKTDRRLSVNGLVLGRLLDDDWSVARKEPLFIRGDTISLQQARSHQALPCQAFDSGRLATRIFSLQCRRQCKTLCPSAQLLISRVADWLPDRFRIQPCVRLGKKISCLSCAFQLTAGCGKFFGKTCRPLWMEALKDVVRLGERAFKLQAVEQTSFITTGNGKKLEPLKRLIREQVPRSVSLEEAQRFKQALISIGASSREARLRVYQQVPHLLNQAATKVERGLVKEWELLRILRLFAVRSWDDFEDRYDILIREYPIFEPFFRSVMGKIFEEEDVADAVSQHF